jgi:dihydrofolate reductase
MGRVVYEHMAAAWPNAEGPFAPYMNGLPKYVVSRKHRALPVPWNNSHMLEGDAADAIAKLKAQPGKDLSIGGSDLAASLAGTGLIDEYRILFVPVFLGGGRPILNGITDRVKLKLAKTVTFGSGTVAHHYVPA